MHSLLHRLHHASIFQNILSSYSMLASWCWKTKAKNNNKSWRNTQKDNRQKEVSPISLTTSLLSSTKRRGHGNFTDARCSVIALPPQAMQAVAFCTASFSAMLWIQKWMFPSSKIPEPSNELSIMHGVGDTMDCIRTCTWLLCGSIHTPWIAQLILPSVVDMVLHMKNEISCTTAVLLHHYQGTVTVVPRHYHSTTRTLLLRYHGTTTALPGHYYCTTTALPGHCCCTTTTHCWSWHGHVLTCRALWRRCCRLSRRTVSCGSISRHDDTLVCRLWTQQTLNVCMASILVTNNSFRSVLNSVVRCCSCCSVPQMDTLRVIQYIRIDKCIPSVG